MITQKHYIAAFTVLTAAYVMGMFNTVLGIDATQYASMSLQMSKTGNWLQLMDGQTDYLDKPPLHFWLSALSFKVFGVSNFAYRLPSFLVTILGVYSTFRLGKLLYSNQVGSMAALMMYGCLGIMLINQDVRTDTVLVGLLAFAMWQMVAYVKLNKWKYLIAGSVGIGMAMLAKGPIGLMVPVLGLGTHILIQRDWRTLFNWKWLVGFIIIFAVIAPFLWGLYQQWDLHPEKSLHGIAGISGVRFFLWDQSFGRLTGTNPFINALQPNQHYDPTFFIHTSAWAFLPWFILSITALYARITALIKRKKEQEYFLLGATILPFIAVSLSEYMLPHYIFITYPFLAILAAEYLSTRSSFKGWTVYHLILALIMIVAARLIPAYVFPTGDAWMWLIFISGLTATLAAVYFTRGIGTAVIPVAITLALAGMMLNRVFYPSLAKYQVAEQVANDLQTMQADPQKVMKYRTVNHALDFYFQHKTPDLWNPATLTQSFGGDTVHVLVEEDRLLELSGYGSFTDTLTYLSFPVTLLNIKFLNPDTRRQELEPVHLVTMVPHKP